MNLPTNSSGPLMTWFKNTVSTTFLPFAVYLVTQSHAHISVTGVKSDCQLSYATETRYIEFVSL